MTPLNWKVPTVMLGIGLCVGLSVGWQLFYPESFSEVEAAAPAIFTDSGAVVLERKPDVPIPEPIKVVAKETKSKVVRAGTVHIEDAKPVIDLDWGLVTNDEGKRITFYTDDGTISGGIDIPVDTTVVKVWPKWSAGVVVPLEYPKGIGPTITRHFGRFSVGISAFKPYEDEQWTTVATAQISW